MRRIRGGKVAAHLAFALTLIGTFTLAVPVQADSKAPPPRPQGPCDIYAAAGDPCVAAHSTTRAMYASYNGPLYQLKRLSDNALKNIGVVQPVASPFPDSGGYADAAAQDAFCANTTCLITKVYDQSPNHNDLTQAPRGAFSGPAMGGANNLPIADMAPTTISGHKAYGVFIEPGMGLRNNDTRGIAVDDQPEGMYWVINGQHFNDGCCYDYGNAEIDSRDDGNGTMETAYYGNAPFWYHGPPPGPWIMTDQENNLVGCVNPGSTSKLCPDLPSISWRFVTAVAKGEPHHWASLGGDSQTGSLATMFDGPRVDSTYDPMRKQGAIVLGNGGDNSNGSQGTFYEGAMTAGYPTDGTDKLVHANVVDAKYNVQRLSLAPASAAATPPGLQTFTPGSSQDTTVKFTNTTGAPAAGVKLSITVPSKQWTSFVPGTPDTSVTFNDPVAPGATVSATFRVTSGAATFNGDLIGNASWTNAMNGARRLETTTEKVRNVSPIKINEFRTGTSSNPTDAFIELYNAGDSIVDLSNWTLTEHPAQQPITSAVTVPVGTTLASHRHYLVGLSSSGLAAPARAGDTTIDVSSSTGLAAGQHVQIGTGSAAETRTIAAVTNTGATGPRVAGRIGNAVKLAGNGEYVQLPEGIVSGLHDFTISAWVNPSQNSAWSRVFDFGTGTTVNMFLTLSAGGGPLRFAITTGGGGAEQRIDNTDTLPLGSWSHVAVTLSGNTGTLYVNGTPVGTNPNMTLHPSDLGATTQNYIGRSQYPDPYLNATVDDFQIYDGALSAADIGALAGGQPGAGDVASYKFDEDSGPTALDSSDNRRNATIISPPSQSTPLWQPLPDGPIITVPAGSTNVPVTSTSGFTVGEKLAIGYGDTFETATVTAVGKPGTQARLAAAAPAGATNIKVTSTTNITAGDTIRLDIGPRIENVTVASVGTSGAGGTGLTLSAPLKFSHSSNLPFSDRGTGVTFTPATRFPHSSNEPVQPLNSAITLDTPLGSSHAINTPVIDTAVTNAGYQGPPAPDQWFGGPALSASAGNMVLRDAHGLVADSLNYGSLVDPWLAEGYQGRSGAGQAGCTVTPPGTATGAGSSAVRYPDGADTDSNCTDFTTSNNPTPGRPNLR